MHQYLKAPCLFCLLHGNISSMKAGTLTALLTSVVSVPDCTTNTRSLKPGRRFFILLRQWPGASLLQDIQRVDKGEGDECAAQLEGTVAEELGRGGLSTVKRTSNVRTEQNLEIRSVIKESPITLVKSVLVAQNQDCTALWISLLNKQFYSCVFICQSVYPLPIIH